MNCLVCGANSWKALYPVRDRMFGLPGKFTELRCNTCSIVRVDPLPTQNQLKRYYPSKNYYSYKQGAKRSFFGDLREYLIAHLYTPTWLSSILRFFISVPALPMRHVSGKVLDIGCGNGDTLSQLKKIGWDVYGLDIDAKAIQSAHSRGLKNVRLGTYNDLSKFPNNHFDVIRMYHVIEHFDHPDVCLKLAYKKLKPGGEIIIGTPNIDSLVAKIMKSRWYNLDAPRHLYVFAPKTLRTLVRKNRFRKLSVSFNSAGGWIGSVQYLLDDILNKKLDLINKPILVILMYPFEWMLDKFRVGDVIILNAVK